MQRTIFDSDHEAFRDSVSHFVERHTRPKLGEQTTHGELGQELWLEAGRQGYLGINVPSEFGGAGPADYRFSAVLSEELARGSVALASCLSIQYDVVAPYLVDLTTADQKERWLPRLCSGELVTAIAMTEPSGGSDLASLRTVAKRDGADWLISGSKIFITNGSGAQLIVVAAKSNPDRGAKGITLFAVEDGMPGLSRGAKLDKIGQHEADTAELFFDNVRVPSSNVIGEVDCGFAHMMQRLPQERIGAAVANLGHVRPIFRQTLAYSRERRAFGQPIGSMQHNKFKLAEMATALDVATAFVDNCVEAHSRGTLSAADAAKAKWWSAAVQNDILDGCLQLYGGYGYIREYPVAQAWADARITRIWAGTNEIMKEIIGRDLGL